MDEQNIGILQRINEAYYQFTASERRVADYVLAHANQVQFMSITQLAEECGTADATVSRFCRALQLKGFNAFKIELARHAAAAESSGAEQEPNDSHSAEGRCREVGRLTQEVVSQTIELVDHKAVEKTLELIENSSRVYCMGTGGSSIIAGDCAHVFSTVSNKFFAVTDAHLQMSAVATMDVGGVIILFSYSGATTAGVQVLELAKSRGLSTVLVTRFPKSPAANFADVVLLCGAKESPVQQGSIRAKVSQLVVMDVLFQEYYYRNRSRCEDNLQNIALALSGVHL